MLGVNDDVTDLAQTQQRWEAQEQRLSTTLDALLEPHLILGPVRDDAGLIVDLRSLRANPAAAAYNHMALDSWSSSRGQAAAAGARAVGHGSAGQSMSDRAAWRWP
jgi:hypothetical protein